MVVSFLGLSFFQFWLAIPYMNACPPISDIAMLLLTVVLFLGMILNIFLAFAPYFLLVRLFFSDEQITNIMVVDDKRQELMKHLVLRISITYCEWLLGKNRRS